MAKKKLEVCAVDYSICSGICRREREKRNPEIKCPALYYVKVTKRLKKIRTRSV